MNNTNFLSRTCSNEECKTVFTVRIPSDPKKYCSKSCSAKTTNKISPKRKPEGKCSNCQKPIWASRKFCEECRKANTLAIKEKQAEENKTKKLLGLPKACITCNGNFYTKAANHIYCSKTCRETHTNYFNKVARGTIQCSSCDNQITNLSRTGKCAKCASKNLIDKKIQSWLNGEWNGGSEYQLSKTVRTYLLEQANYTCIRPGCGFNTPHPDDGKTILEINHIDGNGSNHRPENLEVICPNCHALTPSYRGRNAGFGRKTYYLRVSKA